MDKSIIGQAGFSTIPATLSMCENPHMANDNEILRARLAERLESTGISKHALSKAIGANSGYVRDLLDPEKTGMPSATRLSRLAEELGTTPEWLLGKSDDHALAPRAMNDTRMAWGDSLADGIPVYGTAFCDDLAIEGPGASPLLVERLLLETDHVVRRLPRPPSLWAARDAFAIYLQGTSMEDRYRQGDLVFADPRRPPSPGDIVVVQLNDGAGGTEVVTALVKELVKITSSYVELRQMNPEQSFKVPRKQVAALTRIVPTTELLGG